MKQILLAIDGNVPSRPIFKYAADLCKHISARLCILQFIKNRRDKALEAEYPNHMDGTVTNFATGDCDATVSGDGRLAGVPDPLKRMLKNPSCPVPFSVSLSAGSPENVLSGYVDTHHDIILAVFDPSRDHVPPSSRIKELKKRLGVPLVVVAPAAASPGRAH